MLPHLALIHAPKWEGDARKALPIEVIEHVGLVLRGIDSLVELRSRGPVEDFRVVPCRKLVEPQVEHAVEHQVEAHERVAADTRVGRPAFEVVAVERLDDPLSELFLEVPAVIRNAEQRGDAPRILDRVERATSGVARSLLGITTRPLLQGDADNIVPLRLQQSSRDRRIHAT